MTNLEAIIFDCDGVLFDSHNANLAYYNRIFSHFGSPLVSDPLSPQAQICHTASTPVVLGSLLDPSDVKAALQFAQELDYREFIPLMTESAGLKVALKRLGSEMPLAVATNRGNSMQEVLGHFDLAQYFEVIVTSRDVEKPKPAPDMLLLAARQLGFMPQHCLFVGDSELDRLAAEDAVMPFVAYGENIDIKCKVSSHDDLAFMLLGRENKG